MFIVAVACAALFTGLARPSAAAAPATNPAASREVDEMIRGDIGLREALALPSARSYVQALYAAAGANPNRELGGLFTDSEASEVRARSTLHADVTAIRNYVQANDFARVFGGAFVDNAAGGKIVALFCSSDRPWLAELLLVVPHPSRLDVRPCAYSAAALDTALANLTADFDRLRSEGVTVASAEVDIRHNRLVVRVTEPTTSATHILQGYSPSVAVLGGEPLKAQAGPYTRFNDSTPHSAGIEIHSLPPTDYSSCTLGFDINKPDGRAASLSAGHCGGVGDVWSNGPDAPPGVSAIGLSYLRNVGGTNDTLQMVDQYANGARIPYVYTDYPAKVHVTGSFAATGEAIGTTRCMSGAQCNYHCGVLEVTNSSYSLVDQGGARLGTLNSQRRVCGTLPSISGDSGAPVWHPSGADNFAAGTLNTGDPNPSPCSNLLTTPPSGTARYYNFYYSAIEYQLYGATVST